MTRPSGRRGRLAIRDRFVLLRGSAHEAQLNFGDTGRDVDAGLLLNRERLQLDRGDEPPTRMLAPTPAPTVTSAEALP
jgi:hypothetical protein